MNDTHTSAGDSAKLCADLELAKNRIAELEATERELVRLQEELKASEQRYRTAFEYTGTAMMVVEEDTTVSMGNHRLEEITGYPQSESTRGHSWKDFVADEDVPRLLEFHRLRRENPAAAPSEYEYRLKHRSGEYRDILMNVALIPGTRQSLISLIDITNLKKAQRHLEESEQRFRETADILPAGIADIDLDLSLTYVNKRGLELFGYSEDELKEGAISIRNVVSEEDWGRALEDVTNILSEGYEYGALREYRMVQKDGGRVDVLVNGAPLVASGEVVGIRFILIDITERKQAEEQVAQSERKFRGIFSKSPVGIGLFRNDGTVLEVNSSFLRLFGSDAAREGVPLESFTGTLKEPLSSLGFGKELFMETSRTTGSDGADGITNVQEFEWHISRIGDEGMGEEAVFLAQVLDITERKKAERVQLQQVEMKAEEANRLLTNLRREMVEQSTFHNMVSRSPAMKSIFEYLPEMARASATVLINGESGTGKELIARSLHELSDRAGKPFVAINCSALPDNLLESELFGYKAGAFTDAKTDKPGKFAAAEGGTIFLDEIGDISPAMQVKLLRVLQERCYEPLGAITPVKADIRVVAATNKDLQAMVQEGTFREDLYYRIKVLTVKLPPLRERKCDIPVLCDHFLAMFRTRFSKEITELSHEAQECLLAHEFPGNIRELENIIEHAFIFCKGSSIRKEHLPQELLGERPVSDALTKLISLNSFESLERMYIQTIVREAGGNRAKAAKKMGIHKTSLYRKMKNLGIDGPS